MMSELAKELDFLRSGANLALLAKYIVDGFMMGRHSGTRQGTGREFSQYRSYQPGDDIRRIDWKMFGRSDRYFIKESETETSVTVRFFLDASSSMLYEESGFTRFKYASLIVASLGTLAYRQGDAIALHVVNDRNKNHLREKRGKLQVNRFYDMLDQSSCEGTWPEETEWIIDAMHSHHRELWIICSDMLDGIAPWKRFTEISETFGHEVQYLQILGQRERTLELGNAVTVKDPESPQQLNINSEMVRERYLENLAGYLEQLNDVLLSRKTSIENLTMNIPVQDALVLFLKKREMM